MHVIIIYPFLTIKSNLLPVSLQSRNVKVCVSIDNTSLPGREEMCVNFEQGIPSESRETCWLVVVGEFVVFLSQYTCKPFCANKQGFQMVHRYLQSQLNLVFWYRLYVSFLMLNLYVKCAKNNCLVSALITDQVH